MRAEIQLKQPASDPVSPVEADARQDEVMIAYLPIVRGAAIAVLGYYLFDLATRFFFPGDAYPAVMMTAVAMGSKASLINWLVSYLPHPSLCRCVRVPLAPRRAADPITMTSRPRGPRK